MNSPLNPWCRAVQVAALVLGAFLLLAAPFTELHSQVTSQVISVAPSDVVEGTPVAFKVELRQGSLLERILFVYRLFGETGYRKLDMDVVGNAATAFLPGKEITPPFLEYYLVLVNRAGETETYPLSETPAPLENPPVNTAQITVRPEEPPDSPVTFLSPEPYQIVPPEDVLVSISLLRAGADVAPSSTQLFVDGIDVTGDAVFSGDIIVYAPENFGTRLGPGEHRISVRLLDRDGKLRETATSTFTIQEQRTFISEAAAPRRPYGVAVQIESRREQVSDAATWYNRGSVQLTANAEPWRFRSNIFVTSDEKSDRQPQNRYYAGVESPWLDVGYGDSYPKFPSLLLTGKRVRGLHSSVKLGFFNVDLALGSTVRGIEGAAVRVFPYDSLAREQDDDPVGPYGRIDSLTWGKFRYGTYARDLFVIRPSFGSGETFQLGFTWLKAKDDTSSIRYGTRPQENLVVGSDLLARFDDNHVEFTAQVAMSAYNSDISSGNFTDAYIDSVYTKDAETIKKVRSALQNYITVNDNLRPLSIGKPSMLAYDLAWSADYFNNTFKFGYLFRGSDYASFGQTFLRTDVKGFNITDRLRLVDSQLMLMLGYERLQDNTSDNKIATTTFSNFDMAVAYYPRIDFPRITVGFARYANTNDLLTVGSDSLSAVDDATNRFYLQSLYDFAVGARHTAGITLSTSKRDDNTVRRYNVRNTTLALSLASRYRIPLQTHIELGINANDLPVAGQAGTTASFNYTTLTASGRYGLLRNEVALFAGLTPTFGDVKRTVVELGTEAHVLRTLSILLQFNYFRNQGGPNDSIWSLRCRYDL